jgi:NADH-quinone oxidoreductase subunit L
MGGEQDMRHMGGLAGKIKITYLTMLSATLAISGAPLFAGFFSKDAILFNTYQSAEHGGVLYAVGLFTALLTALYMFRLIFLTFHGKQRYDEHHVHVHESPWSMLGPLVVLGILSIIGGWFALPTFWGGSDCGLPGAGTWAPGSSRRHIGSYSAFAGVDARRRGGAGGLDRIPRGVLAVHT